MAGIPKGDNFYSVVFMDCFKKLYLNLQQKALSLSSLGGPELQEVLACLCSGYLFLRLRKKTQYSVLQYYASLSSELKSAHPSLPCQAGVNYLQL